MAQERVVFMRTMMGKIRESALCQNVLPSTNTRKLALSLGRALPHPMPQQARLTSLPCALQGSQGRRICAKRHPRALN